MWNRRVKGTLEKANDKSKDRIRKVWELAVLLSRVRRACWEEGPENGLKEWIRVRSWKAWGLVPKGLNWLMNSGRVLSREGPREERNVTAEQAGKHPRHPFSTNAERPGGVKGDCGEPVGELETKQDLVRFSPKLPFAFWTRARFITTFIYLTSKTVLDVFLFCFCF